MNNQGQRDDHDPMLRIGAFARRVGMQATTVRAWERRYGLPIARRTVGGQRLYDGESIRQVQMAKRLIEDGWSVQRAARRVAQQAARSGGNDAVALLGRLLAADAAADTAAAHDAASEAVRLLEWGTLVDDVVVPFGASATGRVADLVLGAHVACLAGEQPASGGGRVVVAAAAPGRAALVAAATLALSAAGWEVQPLGDAIDPSTLSDAVDRGEAEVVVVVAAPSDGAAVHALVEPRRARLPAVVIAGPLAEPADSALKARCHDGPMSRLAGTLREA